MTSDVKTSRNNFHEVLGIWRSSSCYGPSAEPEPVNPTVDPADIRGLGTTVLASVGCLPHARHEYACWSLHAIEGCTPPGLRLCRSTWQCVGGFTVSLEPV